MEYPEPQQRAPEHIFSPAAIGGPSTSSQQLIPPVAIADPSTLSHQSIQIAPPLIRQRQAAETGQAASTADPEISRGLTAVGRKRRADGSQLAVYLPRFGQTSLVYSPWFQ